MTSKLFGCVCGQFHSPGAGMGMPEPRVVVPIPFYVLEREGRVTLFDAGLPAAMLDREERYLKALQSQDLDVTMDADTTVTRCLEKLDIDAAKVEQVVVSHLHFDHCGGLRELPNARLVIQRKEWEAGFEPELSSQYALRKRYFDLGHDVLLLDGEHDLFGDSSAMVIPSPGHTPGHQSLRVRTEAGDHILVGDACYHGGVVESRQFPDFSDHAAMSRALDALLATRGPGTVMVWGHDPAQWGEAPVLPSARS